MNNQIKRELLQDPNVIEEISKHRWYESEKKGCDVGFEDAATDWIKKYSKEWMCCNTSGLSFSGWFSRLFSKKGS